jgi:hypothetical protein
LGPKENRKEREIRMKNRIEKKGIKIGNINNKK